MDRHEYIPQESGYKNPLTRDFTTADPCIVYSKEHGCYYGTYTGNTTITLHRAQKLGDMFSRSESTVIYKADASDDTYGYLWAPELHFIDGKWYIYTSTHQTQQNKEFKHVICLRAKTDDPFDGFELEAHINHDTLAIDPTVYQDRENGKLYLCCSIVDSDKRQKLTLQQLKSPGEPMGEAVVISQAEYPWEMVPPYTGERTILEGAYFVRKEQRLFIVYSANGCWSDDYALGILEFTGGNMLSADCWHKHEKPLMTKGNGSFGPGHAAFFYSPDEKELWICHHCLKQSDPECVPMPRYCHCQKVFFDENDFPHLSMPIPTDTFYAPPSGE